MSWDVGGGALPCETIEVTGVSSLLYVDTDCCDTVALGLVKIEKMDIYRKTYMCSLIQSRLQSPWTLVPNYATNHLQM